LHHSGFFAIAFVCISHGLYPFTASLLLCGELSSVPLNIRWFLINNFGGKAVALVNVVFAVTFFAVRIMLNWAGIVYLLYVSLPITLMAKYRFAPALLNAICFLIVCGALLNAYWFVKIMRMALRPAVAKTKNA